MNFIKISFFALLLLNNAACAIEKKTKEPMIDNPSEIIIYVKKGSDLIYNNGFSTSTHKNDATRINDILKNHIVTVKKIGSQNQPNNKTSRVNDLPSMFSIIINDKDAKQVCELLNTISIIDGAYIKPETEEPSMDF